MAEDRNKEFSKIILTDSLSNEALLAAFLHIFQEADMQLLEIAPERIAARTSFSASMPEEVITVYISYGSIEIKSKSDVPGFYEKIENRSRTETLAHRFEAVRPLLTHAFIEEKLSPFRAPAAKRLTQKRSFLSRLLPRKNFSVTPVLLALNILIFAVMVISGIDPVIPASDHMILWGSNLGSATLDGEWWRMISACFLHFGIFHLLLNMYALFSVGAALESMIGSRRFIIAYLIAGIGGNIASLWWNPFVNGAGASGAIFGMFGVFFALVTTDLLKKEYRTSILKQLAFFIVLNLMIGMHGRIDNAAHIGGLVTGLVFGYLFYPGLKWPNIRSWNLAPLIVPVIVAAASIWLLKTLPNRPLLWETKFKAVQTEERKAIKALESTSTRPDSAALHYRRTVIPAWSKAMKLAAELEELDSPKPAKEHASKLKWYFSKQKELYELEAKKLEEKTSRYDEEIHKIEEEIKKRIEPEKEKE